MSVVQTFVNRLGDVARKVEAEEGFNAQFILAQIALETGWLKSVTSDQSTGDYSYNLFNIKGSYDGQSVRAATTEYYTMDQSVVEAGPAAIQQRINQIEGRPIEIISIGEYKNGKLEVRIMDNFKKYPSFQESVNDWIELLKTPRYAEAYAVRDDLEKFAQAIFQAGYATDGNYVQKILDVAKSIERYFPEGEAPEDEETRTDTSAPDAQARTTVSAEPLTSRMSEVFSYKFKFFLQGIEIPFLGAEIQFSAQSYFHVEIPPVNEANDIQPGSYGIIAFKKLGGDSVWHLLCEGIYMGPYYSKQGSNRSLRLKFRDVQWFPENTPLFSVFEQGESAWKDFGLRMQAFAGDVRSVDTGHPEDGVVIMQNYANISSQFAFLSALKNEDGTNAKNPLDRMFQGLFQRLEQGNKFISEHSKALRVDSKRMKSIENDKMSTVYSIAMLEKSFQGLLYQSQSLTSVMDITLMLMQMVHYDIMPIPCMSSDADSALRTYVVKPNMSLLTPPACNVIFPDETINFGFNVDYSIRPTRLWFRGELRSQGDTYGYFAPEQIGREIESLASGGGEHKWVLTDEELMRGVVPQIMRLPFAYTVAIVDGSADLDEWNDYQSRFVNYNYYEMKYRSTPMSLTSTFKPDLLPGFPVLVLDRIMPMIGYCINVGHTIDVASGSAYTSVTLSHVRPAGDEVPLLTGWYDAEQFHPDNIGEQVYASLGTHSFWTPLENKDAFKIEVSEENMVRYDSAVKEMIEEYVNALQEGLSAWKAKWSRKLPVFFNENDPESNDILRALNLKWNTDSERLETIGSGSSPVNVDIEVGGTSINTLREAPVLKLKETLTTTRGLWTRHLLEEE